ncbi:MAG TPA: response regulator [Solirubrobacteraceae bacterium]|nr:response regulator [Solirubrobacteraceae bacterium]
MSETISHDDRGLADASRDPAEREQARKRILFVDDEPDLLESLRDAMRRYRRQWQVDFARGGNAALELLGDEPADVVVADMQMPEMDGATLLQRVRDLYPTTLRMVLSGHASPQLLTRAATVAHRFLGKPFDAAELGLLIERSCALRELTEEAEAFRVTAAATALPSRPGVYTRLTNVLSDPGWEPADVAKVVEADIAITAKVLQLANSAFFGVGREVTSVQQAVVYLGVETIKSLTLTAETFGVLAPETVHGFSIDEFQRHAMLVARIAAGILPDGRSQQEAVTAALLHDVGKLVLIADDPFRWARLNHEAHRLQQPLHRVELEQEGVTHAATGAYLLSLWGLPDGVVEAVAHHHDPGALPGLGLDPVAVVHIANALANELAPKAEGRPPAQAIDDGLVHRLGLARKQSTWRGLATKYANQLPAAAGSWNR